MSNTDQNIYIIDGHALLYRAYYAIRELKTSKGMPTNAVYGFINILRKLIDQYKPGMVAVVFDSKGPTERHLKYSDYKIHRKPMPDDMLPQLAKVKEVISAYGIVTCELQGFEADDIIATMARKAKNEGFYVTIVTGDKDALQLVDEDIKVLSPHTLGDKLYNAKEVEKKYGVEPRLMVELVALMGDPSDNIPGVKGIGLVTAGKLIKQYSTIRDLYERLEEIPSDSLRKKLIEGREMAELSRQLVELNTDVPVEFDADKVRLKKADKKRLAELYEELEFNKLLHELLPEDRGQQTPFVTVDSPRKAVEVKNEIFKAKNTSVSMYINDDTKLVEGVAFSCADEKCFFFPLTDTALRDVFLPFIKEIMESQEVTKIAYDIKHIVLSLRNLGINVAGSIFDIMIADYLLDPSRPKYDLEGIVARHLGYALTEESGGDIALAECSRSSSLLKLQKSLEASLKEKRLESLFNDVEMPLAFILADMERQGVNIDIEYLKASSAAAERELEKLTKRIHEIAGEKFNINSPKQLQLVLYEKLKLPIIKKTKTGSSTDESVLRKLAARHEMAAYMLKYREMNKLKTTYYDSILEMTDKKNATLHARFNQTATATGRLSSSEPNLQNIPIKTELARSIRRAFTSGDKNHVLLAADYSQVELRILAHLSSDDRLIEAFEKGEDVHRLTAADVFNVSLKDVTDEMRSMAKTVNFGIIYGMGAFGLAKDMDLDIEKAKGFIDAYFKRYKGVEDFIASTIDEARKKEFVTTLLGRRRYIPEINSKNGGLKAFAERAAINTRVQGSAADLIKLAMIECHKFFKNGDVKMIIQLHDELIFRLPKNMLNEAAGKVKDIMENVMKLKVPLKVDVEWGMNWLDMERISV